MHRKISKRGNIDCLIDWFVRSASGDKCAIRSDGSGPNYGKKPPDVRCRAEQCSGRVQIKLTISEDASCLLFLLWWLYPMQCIFAFNSAPTQPASNFAAALSVWITCPTTCHNTCGHVLRDATENKLSPQLSMENVSSSISNIIHELNSSWGILYGVLC